MNSSVLGFLQSKGEENNSESQEVKNSVSQMFGMLAAVKLRDLKNLMYTLVKNNPVVIQNADMVFKIAGKDIINTAIPHKKGINWVSDKFSEEYKYQNKLREFLEYFSTTIKSLSGKENDTLKMFMNLTPNNFIKRAFVSAILAFHKPIDSEELYTSLPPPANIVTVSKKQPFRPILNISQSSEDRTSPILFNLDIRSSPILNITDKILKNIDSDDSSESGESDSEDSLSEHDTEIDIEYVINKLKINKKAVEKNIVSKKSEQFPTTFDLTEDEVEPFLIVEKVESADRDTLMEYKRHFDAFMILHKPYISATQAGIKTSSKLYLLSQDYNNRSGRPIDKVFIISHLPMHTPSLKSLASKLISISDAWWTIIGNAKIHNYLDSDDFAIFVEKMRSARKICVDVAINVRESLKNIKLMYSEFVIGTSIENTKFKALPEVIKIVREIRDTLDQNSNSELLLKLDILLMKMRNIYDEAISAVSSECRVENPEIESQSERAITLKKRFNILFTRLATIYGKTYLTNLEQIYNHTIAKANACTFDTVNAIGMGITNKLQLFDIDSDDLETDKNNIESSPMHQLSLSPQYIMRRFEKEYKKYTQTSVDETYFTSGANYIDYFLVDAIKKLSESDFGKYCDTKNKFTLNPKPDWMYTSAIPKEHNYFTIPFNPRRICYAMAKNGYCKGFLKQCYAQFGVEAPEKINQSRLCPFYHTGKYDIATKKYMPIKFAGKDKNRPITVVECIMMQDKCNSEDHIISGQLAGATVVHNCSVREQCTHDASGYCPGIAIKEGCQYIHKNFRTVFISSLVNAWCRVKVIDNSDWKDYAREVMNILISHNVLEIKNQKVTINPDITYAQLFESQALSTLIRKQTKKIIK